MLGLLGGIWGKIATLFVGFAGLLATMFGWRYSIRKNAKREINEEVQRRTLERVRIRDEMRRRVDAMSDGDIRDKLRERGYID